jgi:4-hydroxyphenylpyruvate dioxygenase
MTGFDHLELWVGNARAFSRYLMWGFGFECIAYGGPETGLDRVSYALAQGRLRLVVTAAMSACDEIAGHVLEHGDGVKTVAFATDDVEAALDAARLRGGSVVAGPRESADESGTLRRGSIAAYGDTIFSFVDRDDYAGAFLPGFTKEDLPRTDSAGSPGLTEMDHVVANVEEGTLDGWVRWHEQVLGLRQMRHFDADQISTEYSALRSTVVWNGGRIVLPVNEPAPGLRKSQITEYLESYGGPGVQHVALRTDDIVAAVGELTRRGIRFLVPPPAYYEDARSRCGERDLPWETLEQLGILVDVDSGGVLLQVFTETLADRPTLFFEVIERRGATGFGEGNFKALFEAIEREQARRGNL